MSRRINGILLLLFIGLSSLVCFPIALTIWLLTVLFDRRLVILHMFTCFWACIYLWVVPVWSLRFEGRRDDAWKRNFVIVSNHQSQLDILVAFRLFIPFKWVSKIEVFRLPLIGWNMMLNRYIRLKRGDKAGIRRMFRDCEQTLANGSSVYLFPEGTRSKTGMVKIFKPGAFILAKKMNVPILPVVIHGTNKALPKHSLNFKGRTQMRIRMLESIPPEEFEDISVEELAERVRQIIADELEKMDE